MKLLFFLFLLPAIVHAQLSDELRDKVRNSTDDYHIQYDTLAITGSKTLPCLDVTINGKGPYRFLVDLGSNIVVFKQSVVEGAGMEILVDRATSDIVKAGRLQIGDCVFNNVHGAAYQSLDVDGVIGFNLLRKANFFMDYPRMSFGFIKDEPVQTDSTYIKYEVIGRMPYLKSSIGNKSVFINFDTGAALWLYFPLNFRDSISLISPLKDFREMTNNQTGTVKTYIGQVKDDVVFGNYRIRSPHVIFDPAIEDIFVGSSLLNQFKLSFYTKKELVRMERAGRGDLIVIPEDQKKN